VVFIFAVAGYGNDHGFCVSCLSAKSSQRENPPFTNYSLARHFFVKTSGPAILVHVGCCQNRKEWSWSPPPFVLCINARCVNCLLYSGTSRRQYSLEI